MKIETERGDGVATVVVSGEVDSSEKAQVGQAIRSLLDQGETRFIFDFTRVTYIGSTGVGCLISARRDAVAKAGGVAVVSPPPMLRKVFRTLGLEKDFPVFPTRAEALKALRGASPTGPPPTSTSPPPR